MTKKRLSIIAFIAVIIMGVGIAFAHSKLETPDQHAENATKITQVAEKGKPNGSSFSSTSNNSGKTEVNVTDKKTAKTDSANTTKSSNTKKSEAVVQSTKNKTPSNEIKNDSKPNFKKPNPKDYDTSLVQKPTKGVSTNSSDYQNLLEKANHHTDSNKKDKYLTDPTPEGMPTPVEPQDVKIDPSTANYCTLSIRCDTILNNRSKLHKNKKCMVPDDGVIYSEKRVVFYKGESVFNVLVRETAKNRIQMDFQNTPIYNSAYIRGIHNLYEFDCGSLSGWMYKVNGWFPNYGCSRYQLKSGDKIEWVYTCDLGRDVGCIWIGDKK